MTDKKDETGKGPSSRPGDPQRRPYATLDLQATEVGAKEQPGDAKPGGSSKRGGSSGQPSQGSDKDGPPRSWLAARLAAAGTWLPRDTAGATRFLSHGVAGIAGAIVAFALAALLGLFGPGDEGPSAEVSKRLSELERASRQRASAQGTDTARLSQTENRLKELEAQQTRALSALSEAQTKLAASMKSLETRSGSADYAARLSKIETAVAALSADDRSGQAGALAEKLTALEKQVGEAMDAAKSGADRAERNRAATKAEVSDLAKQLETLRGETEQRLKAAATSTELGSVAAKLAAFERDLQAFLKGEDDRTSNAARVLLALEIANLKRAVDRGERYTAELEAARKLAGKTLNLAPLARYSQEGAPTLPSLAKDFRRTADSALDAEAEQPGDSVIDRLMSGARSIVRVRKTGHGAEDMSTEAIFGRMETALKDGRLAEVLEQGKKLPPKAALATEDWLKKVEARYAVDRALADVELALKSTLAGKPAPAPEPKR